MYARAEGLFILLRKIFCCWRTLICTTIQQWLIIKQFCPHYCWQHCQQYFSGWNIVSNIANMHYWASLFHVKIVLNLGVPPRFTKQTYIVIYVNVVLWPYMVKAPHIYGEVLRWSTLPSALPARLTHRTQPALRYAPRHLQLFKARPGEGWTDGNRTPAPSGVKQAGSASPGPQNWT